MRNSLASTILVLCLVFLFLPNSSYSMPHFARKYDKNCGMCHTQIPKLNQTGYEFRQAGYRLPDEIGQKEGAFNMGDFFAARLQTQYTYTKHDDVNPGNNTSNSQLEFTEFTMYPLTGSWGENFGSLVELSMAPDDVFEVENAFVRGVYGDADGWYQARVGIMHPWEGFGASDRPLGLSRPLFQKQKATGSPFILWNLDETAIEVGHHSVKTGTSISARMSNGIIWKKDGSGKAEPAQGGALAKPANQPGQQDKSYQIVLNQIVRKDSGLTLYYYRGTVPFPNLYDSLGTLLPGPFTKDTFDRLALYGNWFAVPKTLNLLVGYGSGKDSLDDSTVSGGTNVGESSGYFVEADYHVTENKLAVGARYDGFDPSKNVNHNSQQMLAVFANYTPVQHLQLVGEYSQKKTEQTAGGENEDNQFAVNFIFIF
jgi:hypothetical protein